MTQSEREQMAAMEREPALAEKLISEMDRAGRDYLKLREVEAQLCAKDAEIASLKTDEARLLCPPHRQLDESGGLEPFDNCVACIRNERDELRKEVAAHLKAIVYQCQLREDSNRDRDVWKRKAKAAEAEFSATFADRNELLAHYQRVTAEKLALEAQITLLQGAIAAQDERERLAGERCGVPYEMHACDWPEWVADEVLTLRADRDEWKRKAEAAEARVEDMEREATEDATEQDRLLAYARKMRGRRDVHNVYEVFDWMQAQLAVTKTQLNEAVAETQVLEYQRDQIASTFAHQEARINILERQLAAAREVIEASRCIRHWHDWGPENEGMVVSQKHVFALWEALEKYDATREKGGAFAWSDGEGTCEYPADAVREADVNAQREQYLRDNAKAVAAWPAWMREGAHTPEKGGK